MGAGLFHEYLQVAQSGAGRILLEPPSVFKSQIEAAKTVAKYQDSVPAVISLLDRVSHRAQMTPEYLACVDFMAETLSRILFKYERLLSVARVCPTIRSILIP